MISPMRLALISLVGCAGTTSTVAQPPADPAPCADVATHELAVMSIGFIGDQKTSTMRLKIQARCHDDSWSLEARRCVLTAAGFDDMTACHDKLSSTQRTALQHELRGSNDADIPEQPSTAPPELLK
jgi:hypothetical protein